MNRFSSNRRVVVFLFPFAVLLFVSLATPQSALGQATIATGSIQGTILDASGAAVPGAKITITNKDTGQISVAPVTSAGAYTSGAVVPGNYSVRAEAKGFKTIEEGVIVRVGVTSGVNLTLQVGTQSTVIEVAAETVAVNTEQPSVQGVLTKEQIENLPINGHNFLDLAQLEPGVQIQDGGDFDPTKQGFSSISFGGRFGRTARISVDGLDVSDETVGTTTINIPESSIEEFQLSQSSLDMSNELTSSGAVNVVTRSGTNSFHGEGFEYFRDSSLAAALPGPPSAFQRNQFGANIGGPVLKDKLFFFIDGERTKQDLFAPVVPSAPFAAGGYNDPLRDNNALIRVDWQPLRGLHAFVRVNYFWNKVVATGVGFSPYQDKNHTRADVAGADFTTGGFSHSFRFEYLKFENDLVDATAGTNLLEANFPVSITISPLSLLTGPNFLAPQQTFQTDRQIKYDGSKTWGSHIIRYGASFNVLRGGGGAFFSSITPNVFPIGSAAEINAATPCAMENPPVMGCGVNDVFTCSDGSMGAACPLNYPVDAAVLGNGLGFGTEIPAFNEPAGGTPTDYRLGTYIGDSWKIKPNLTMTYGLRYVRDTGRSDDDLPPLAALNALLPGLGNSVIEPNKNIGPQAGIAWAPWKDGKTVIRAGIGLFYENAIWNNVEFDRPERLATGAFLFNPTLCSNDVVTPVPFPNGTLQTPPGFSCTGLIGTEGPIIAAFQKQYEAATLAAGVNAPNPSYIPSLIAAGSEIPLGALAPQYKSPRAVQMNVGVQREIRPGMVLSVDYLRNVGLHYLVGIDANHSGDVAYFNQGAALQAIGATNATFGCPGTNAAAINCAISSAVVSPFTGNPGASMVDYASNGLDSAADLGVGSCPTALGFSCAFQGINPGLGEAVFLYPGGRSVYNALDVKLVDNVKSPMPGVKYLNFQFAYSLSRFVNCGASLNTSAGTSPGAADQDFINPAINNRTPCSLIGPSALDRTHQISFGGYADLPFGFRLSTIFHFDSPLPASLAVPVSGLGAGEIFRTDFDGDGTVGDPLPGTKYGAFMRTVGPGDLNVLINNYNNTVAGQLTPAGQVLVGDGLFTPAQMGVGNANCLNNPAFKNSGINNGALCAVAPLVPTAPPGEVGLYWLKVFDVGLAWEGHVKERLTIEPSATFYNVFNFANFDIPGNVLSGLLTGTPGTVNGTTYATGNSVRIGNGTGVFNFGAPRTIEFGLKFTF
ncbi:MAG TPA: carboxypeptidase regulatory-like domain-containing protein [Candidatus Sulfotelmatobacter sp.]|nr:carboxypeptidase regulatory-like domain-containing protein [Candidatus Sulfotelmatobacter sp.]